VIRFLWSESENACEISERITVRHDVKSAGQWKFCGRYKARGIWSGKSSIVILTDFKEH
jgi:hypothetical protein